MRFRIFLATVTILAMMPATAIGAVDWAESWTEAMAGAARAWPAGADPATARDRYGAALDLVIKHGSGTLRHARTLDELAYLNLMDGAEELAESLYLESIPMLERLLGPDQPRLATSIHNLGVLYLRTGKNDEAEPWIREALRIWTSSFGPDHPDTARANRSLAVLMRRRGQDDEADRLERLAGPYLKVAEE